jgi:murein L,D-transpeptidase YcbB/YkuD
VHVSSFRKSALIRYVTAILDADNQVYFFNDIYGHDSALEKALSHGYLYPR